jgi:type I restriction enzyme M protein
MPSGVFKPYAGVSTAVVVFTKTNNGGTDNVWFYDMQADGYSLDDKRSPITDNDIADIVQRFKQRAQDNKNGEHSRNRTEQSFLVPFDEIKDNDWDLSINRYKEIVYEEVEYAAPAEIIAEIEKLDGERSEALRVLKGLLG